MWRIKEKLNALKIGQKGQLGDLTLVEKFMGVMAGALALYIVLIFFNAIQNSVNPLIDNQAQAAAIRILYGIIPLAMVLALLFYIFSSRRNEPPQY